MKYLTIENGEFKITDRYIKQEEFAIIFKHDGKDDAYIFGDTPVIVDGKNIILGERYIPIKDLTVVPIDGNFDELLTTLQSEGINDVSTKSISDRVPDPRLVKMGVFTAVICNAILANGRNIPLIKKKRVRKANLIRNIKKQIEKGSEISVALGFELLELSGINPADIFNDNYIVK